MIPAAVLIAALALPPQRNRFARLDVFFKLYGGYEYYMTDQGKPDGKGWESTPFVWQGQRIWVKKN